MHKLINHEYFSENIRRLSISKNICQKEFVPGIRSFDKYLTHESLHCKSFLKHGGNSFINIARKNFHSRVNTEPLIPVGWQKYEKNR